MVVDAPIVLEIGIYDLVAVVVLLLSAPLRVARDVAHQHVRKGVSRADRRIGGTKREDTLHVGRIFLVLLREGGVRAKLKYMFAERLRHIVAIGVGWVGIVPREVARVISPLTAPVRRVRAQSNGWEFAPEAIIENRTHGEARGQAHRPQGR